MRLAIVSPNRNAWSETFIANHIAHLPDVELVLTDGFLPTRDIDGDPLLKTTPWPLLVRRLRGDDLKAALTGEVMRLFRKHRIDVVLAEYGPTGMALAEICRQLQVPLVTHFHGVDAWHDKLMDEHGRYARLFRTGAAFVAVSREMERQLVALGAPREKVFYNCYGIDLDRFVPGDPAIAPPHFFAVGRFADTKAPHLTLLAFERAWQQEKGLRLTMAGQGVLWETCVTMARALGLSDAVSFPGVLTHEQVAEAMRGARAFVQHSVITSQHDREGTPLAILEAMASGLPVIATRHAGIVDVVAEDERGLLCDEGDIGTMAGHMLTLARDGTKAATMGSNGRAYVEREHRMERSHTALHAILARAART